jgi:hypothetical protein
VPDGSGMEKGGGNDAMPELSENKLDLRHVQGVAGNYPDNREAFHLCMWTRMA